MSKIEYNDEISNSTINYLNICADYLREANNIFYNMYCPSGFRYAGTLSNLKNSVVNSKEDIYDYKDDINRCMEQINKNELELLSVINKIEDIKIKGFDFEIIWR